MQNNVEKARIYLETKIMANQLPKLNALARRIFQKTKAQILDDFDVHPITRAIDDHDTYEGIPNGGSLFGFIGFNEGDNPTDDIRKILVADFDFIGVSQSGPRTLYISFSVPSSEDIFAATPTEWAEGRSWTEMMETGGISGVGAFLSSDRGRSEEGTQAKKSFRGGKFGPHKYISDFLKKSESKIRKKLNEELILT